MSTKNVLVVFGATGAQGGSVIKSILADPEASAQFSLRGVTRDSTSAKAQALSAQGVELVKADLNSKSSVAAALKGAYAAFAVTNFWETGDANVEMQQGRNVADAAKEVGLQHLVWSSLLNVTELTQGRLSHVTHFDSKAAVEAYIRSIDVPATFVLPGFYMSNIPGSLLRKDPTTNTWKFSAPFPDTTPIPLLDTTTDTGTFVKAALLNRPALLSKRLYAASAFLTPSDILAAFRRVKPVAGTDADFVRITEEQFKAGLSHAGLNATAQTELYENFMLMSDVGYYGKGGEEGLQWGRQFLKETPVSWEEFVGKAPAFKELE